MITELTQEQRDFIVKQIESSINDGQVYDYYDFDNITITWVQADESYIVENNGEQIRFVSPRDIAWYIDDLSDQQLIDWFIEEHCCDDWFEECLEEEMQEVA
jgi:hypothetical protein